MSSFFFIDATDHPSRIKHAQQGLRASFQCQESVGIIEQHRTSTDPDDYTENFAQEAQRLLAILNGRIQTFLKELVRIFKLNSQKKSLYDDSKEMYGISLRIDEKSPTFIKDLYDGIERIKNIFDKHTSD